MTGQMKSAKDLVGAKTWKWGCSRVGPALFPFSVCLVVSFSAAPSLASPPRQFWWRSL